MLNKICLYLTFDESSHYKTIYIVVGINSNVPKGSVLCPIIFVAYNDLPEHPKSRVRLFADDTAMHLAISSTTEGQVLQTDLACLEQCKRCGICNFNPSKC